MEMLFLVRLRRCEWILALREAIAALASLVEGGGLEDHLRSLEMQFGLERKTIAAVKRA
jgi:hypothetical protein